MGAGATADAGATASYRFKLLILKMAAIASAMAMTPPILPYGFAKNGPIRWLTLCSRRANAPRFSRELRATSYELRAASYELVY